MAHLCLRYLSMDCFGAAIGKEDITRFVDSGHYSFSEYAIMHWPDHLISALSLDIDKQHLDQLAESTDSFLAQHFIQKQPIEWAPEEVKVALGRVSARSFFIHLVQAIALLKLRRNPELIRKRKGDLPECRDNNLNLEDVLCKIRNTIEEAGPKNKMIEYYGSKLFKCDRIDCTSFYEGFFDPQAAKSHINKHDYRCYCFVKDCPRGPNGFASEARLREHHRQFHCTNGYSTDFPSTYDWSDYCLKEAVRSGDITHLNKFYFENLPAQSKHEVSKPILLEKRRASKVVWREALEHMNDTMLNYLADHTDFERTFAQRFILEKAAETGNIDAIRRFIGDEFREANYESSLFRWNRAIEAAIQRQDLDILNMLLEPTLRSPKSSTTSYKDKLRDNCVKVCRLGHLELVKYFVEVAGVTISGRRDKGPSPESENPPGRIFSMLYHASEMGHENVLRYLFGRMDSTETQPPGIEEIKLLMQTAAVNFHLDILILLGDRFQQVSEQTLIEYMELSLIYLSIRISDVAEVTPSVISMIESLESSKCDFPDMYGWTNLMYAAYSSDSKVVDALIKKKASCYARGYEIFEIFPHTALCHRTPFEIAWLVGHKESATLLQQAQNPNKLERVVSRRPGWDRYGRQMDDNNFGVITPEALFKDRQVFIRMAEGIRTQLQVVVSRIGERTESSANASNESKMKRSSDPVKQSSKSRGVKRPKLMPYREAKRRIKEPSHSPSRTSSWLREGVPYASGEDADMSG